MGKYFGTDGFRGKANVELSVGHAYRIGKFLAYYFGKQVPAQVVIGKDTRLSGGMLESALIAGLTSAGGNAYLLGVTATPNVAYITSKEAFDVGVMISASHNPFYDNGIKLFSSTGSKIDAKLEAEIEAYIDSKDDFIKDCTMELIGKKVDYPEGVEKYIEHITQVSDMRFTGMKIGLDLAHGSSTKTAVEVFDRLGAEVYVISNAPNGININEQCGSTHIDALVDFVKKHDLDAGFAFDGDADRIIAVANDGTIVDGDRILYICGKDLKERGLLFEDTIVTTVMSNMGLYLALNKANIKHIETSVGDKYVHQAMDEYGYELGGEQSGHIIFSRYASTGDGVLTGVLLLEAIKRSGKSFSNLAHEVDIYPQVLKNIIVKDKEAAQKDPELLKIIKQVEDQLQDEGRVLVRASGTEPLIRVMVEAKTIEMCHASIEKIEPYVK